MVEKLAFGAIPAGATSGGQAISHTCPDESVWLSQVDVPGAARSASKTYTLNPPEVTNAAAPLSCRVESVLVPTAGVAAARVGTLVAPPPPPHAARRAVAAMIVVLRKNVRMVSVFPFQRVL
jgi:hypothetical protein